MPADLFTILPPQGEPLPIVANLPHSGLQVPTHIAESFTPDHLQSLPNSDWHLQELYRFLPSLGITVMQANYSRYVVDLNRGLKLPFFGSFWSAVVPEQTAFKQPIYTTKPSPAAVRDRIDEYYTPYHQRLTALLNETAARFNPDVQSGFHQPVYLLDLHSFMGLITDQVCLGNAKGSTCSDALIETVEAAFSEHYQVVKNKVFTGGYITRHYAQPPAVESLQIEIRYPTYLSEAALIQAEASPKCIPHWQGAVFEEAQRNLQQIFETLCLSISAGAIAPKQ